MSLEWSSKKLSVYMLAAEKAEEERRNWVDSTTGVMAKVFTAIPEEARNFHV